MLRSTDPQRQEDRSLPKQRVIPANMTQTKWLTSGHFQAYKDGQGKILEP